MNSWKGVSIGLILFGVPIAIVKASYISREYSERWGVSLDYLTLFIVAGVAVLAAAICFWVGLRSEIEKRRAGIPMTLAQLQENYPGFAAGDFEMKYTNTVCRVNSDGLRVPIRKRNKVIWHLDTPTGEFGKVNTQVGREYLYSVIPFERRDVEWLRMRKERQYVWPVGAVWLVVAAAGFLYDVNYGSLFWWCLNLGLCTLWLGVIFWRTKSDVLGPEPRRKSPDPSTILQQPHIASVRVTSSDQPVDNGRLS